MITRLCWIGEADRFPPELLDDPRFDVTWLDVRWLDATPKRLPDCDAVLLDAPKDPPRLQPSLAKRAAPLLVRSGDTGRWHDLGADAVLPADACVADLRAALDLLRGGAAGERDTPVAVSAEMRAVFRSARGAGRSDATVLIVGETGTGKEVVARAVHEASDRAERSFVALNCAALPDGLLESELFGHTRGAFTGAERERKGAFEEADGGTLFLDEVGETSGAFQAKLLRVLQERAFRPLGAPRSRRVDVRVLAATHRDLPREVAAGRFREDLFFRLAVVPIPLPPLRERRDDILALAEHFLRQLGARERKPGCTLAASARQRLRHRSWPGNVRELENAIQRALIAAAPGSVLHAEAFDDPWEDRERPEASVEADTQREAPLRENLDRVEAWLIRDALDRQHGHKSATARTLGLTREGLYKKMKRLGIE
ncbi:MAG: sigma 54-interacting transcriptional regulator [Myxococcota bacterium]